MTLSARGRALLARLEAPLGADDRARLAPLLAEVDARALALAELDPTSIDADALTRARIATSSTLARKGTHALETTRREAEAWARANAYVVTALANEVGVSLDGIRHVAALVAGTASPAPYRTTTVFLDAHECVPVEEIEPLLAPMTNLVALRTREDGALVGAALLYQWLATVHPFADGNGRTSRLAADWLLGQEGFLPISYEKPWASWVAVHLGTADERTLADAVDVVARGVLHTMAVVSAPRRR